MLFEWDGIKREKNLRLHGIDFERAKEIWQGPVLEIPSSQTQHGETRYLGIGETEGRFLTVVFTWRENRRRIISARIARRDEREKYQKEIS